MKKPFVEIFSIVLLASMSLFAQPDTLSIKQQIANLTDQAAIQNYLNRIYEEDQKYRGRQTNDSLDFEHLISMSYFINKFGYPERSVYGDASSAPWLVWKHNEPRAFNKLTFSIILKGFLKKELKEFDLRDYYLRSLYHFYFDDNNFKSMPLPELFEAAKVNIGPDIDVRELLKEKKK